MKKVQRSLKGLDITRGEFQEINLSNFEGLTKIDAQMSYFTVLKLPKTTEWNENKMMTLLNVWPEYLGKIEGSVSRIKSLSLVHTEDYEDEVIDLSKFFNLTELDINGTENVRLILPEKMLNDKVDVFNVSGPIKVTGRLDKVNLHHINLVNQNNNFQGIYKFWHENGKLAEDSFYKDGKLDGEYRSWYDNGVLEQHFFNEGGRKKGEYKSWHENGERFELYFVKDGIYRAWHENGELATKSFRKNGKLDGEYRSWHDNGKKYILVNHKNGNKEGKYEEFYDNGIQRRVLAFYVNGCLDGVYKKWHENGELAQLTHYSNCKENGVHEEWYDDGNPSKKYFTTDGQFDGIYEEWHRNGDVKMVKLYKKGYLQGNNETQTP